ncbi:flippase activity-associated protein Agl23 [Haloprofundus sp. MHR1]|uniref:flippase activity-associated protein Agl23 n=1 Tax=Haloprofundus sp. MHR1 TaxID=2572921 RepID=UPI0010BEB0E5|nr:flippase activity-associated protein Agl23 [Haloprofundus sp. MHR1]QCJ47915.1 TIGR03663 family protein [Haloprofundus sp. MHR1]
MTSDDGVGASAPTNAVSRSESETATPEPLLAGARTLYAVLSVTALALLARVVGLGARIMHWDEGRVGYWALRYHENGEFFYRPIIHGPFIPVVNDWVFTLVGVSDFSARLVVAVVGGLFPLAAWLFREHLDDTEVVGLALVLAANPLLVYYSRFMRNDVLVAVFSVFALGFVVRAVDTGRLRYLYFAAVSMGLAFTTKGNAILYIACYLGAAVLVFDHRLVELAARGDSVGSYLRSRPAWAKRRLTSRWNTFEYGAGVLAVNVVGALLVFLAIVAFFYAPRPELGQALGNPAALPGVLDEATVGAAESFYDSWGSGDHQDHPYLPFFYGLSETLVYGAGLTLVFAVVGLAVDGYGSRSAQVDGGGDGGGRGRRGRRWLVAFGLYWGVASLVGYPIATDIEAPWAAVHVVVPLAFPASVGIAYLYRETRASVVARDTVSVGLAAIVVVAALSGVVGANAAYIDSTSQEDKEVLQWAQPDNDLKATMQTVGRIAETNEGVDVLFYGSYHPTTDETLLYVENEESLERMPPGGPAWHSRLPLPWYLERVDANVTSTEPSENGTELQNPPPVVVAYEWEADNLREQLPGYTEHRHLFRLWSDEVVVFVDESAIPEE